MINEIAKTVTFELCSECNIVIGDGGLCSYGCKFDTILTSDRTSFNKAIYNLSIVHNCKQNVKHGH